MLFRVLFALLPMILTYVIGIGLERVDAYALWYPTSPIMHALGGFVTAWTIWNMVRLYVATKHIKKTYPLFLLLSVIGGTVIVGVAWEWYEYILDLVYHTHNVLGVGDTLLDLAMDTFGAVVYSVFLMQKEI